MVGVTTVVGVATVVGAITEVVQDGPCYITEEEELLS